MATVRASLALAPLVLLLAPALAAPPDDVASSPPARLRPAGLAVLRFEPDSLERHPGVYRARGRRFFVTVDGEGAELASAGAAINMRFVNRAGATARPEPEERLPGVSSYFVGEDPAAWRRGVAGYGRVRVRDVYPGIDAVYYGTPDQLEYDLLLRPGADPAAIRIAFAGQSRLELDARGDLVLRAGPAELRQRRPRVYQEIAGQRREVRTRYVRHGAREVGLELGAYDRARPLVVDPVVEFFQYVGGGGSDNALAVAVDPGPKADSYVAGFSVLANGKPSVAAVWKYGPHGEPIWNVYFGNQTAVTIARGVAFYQGRVYIAGLTAEPKLKTTGGAWQFECPRKFNQMTCNGNRGFVARLDDSKQGAIVNATYLAGSDFDEAFAVATDVDGSVYVAGDAHSTDLISYNQKMIPGARTSCLPTVMTGKCDDAFLAKFEPTLSTPIYMSFLGGDGVDTGRAVTIAGDRSAWVAGTTSSVQIADPQILQAGRQFFLRGAQDAYVLRLSPSGGLLTLASYFGGSGFESGTGVALDDKGMLYLAGTTDSTDFPDLQSIYANGRYSPAVAPLGGQDGFLVKLDPSKRYKLNAQFDKVIEEPLVYASLAGGAGNDAAAGVAVGPGGIAALVGATDSVEKRDPPQAIAAGKGDGFIAQYDALGGRRYHSYLGGQEADRANAVAVDAAGFLRVAGFTTSPDLGLTVSGHAIQSTYRNGGDGFLLSDHPPRIPVVFIPGLLGSVVQRFNAINGRWEELWLGLAANHRDLTLWPGDSPSRSFWDPVRMMSNGPERMRVPDVFRLQPDIPGLRDDYYNGLLEAIKGAGFVEYQVTGPDLEDGAPAPHPERRSAAACDLSQMKGIKGDPNDPRNPVLFPLAYDWRIDNNAHVAELRSYIDCIRQFYPGTKVNIVAHSMGNLITRRYLLKHSVGTMSGKDESYVQSYVTIGAPILGVPKFFFVALTGDTGIPKAAVFPSTFKYLLGSLQGPGQLLAGEYYFRLTSAINSPSEWPAPFIEDGWDVNGKNGDHEVYTYEQSVEAVNLLQKAEKSDPAVPLPGDAAKQFHSLDYPKGDQDDWNIDNTSVNYYHIIGLASHPFAIGQAAATVKARCVDYPGQDFSMSDNCQQVINDRYGAKRLVPGDNTVAHLSALRRDPASIAAVDYNKKGARILVVQGTPKEVDHATGICSHPKTVAAVLGVVNGNPAIDSFPGPPPPPPLAIFDVLLRGVDAPVVTDTQGNSTAPVPIPGVKDGGAPDTILAGTVPNVFQFHQGDKVEGIALPTTIDRYTATFTVLDPTVAIEINLGTGLQAKRVVRYLDRKIAKGLRARLVFNADETMEPLRIDVAGNGTFTQLVMPDVDVAGKGADDLDAPTIQFAGRPLMNGQLEVSVAAFDPSGVSRIFTSLDDISYSRYKGPLTVDPQQVKVVNAFAEDKLGNRSGRYRWTVMVGGLLDGGALPDAARPIADAAVAADAAAPLADAPAAGDLLVPADSLVLGDAGPIDAASAGDAAALDDGPIDDAAVGDGAVGDGALGDGAGADAADDGPVAAVDLEPAADSAAAPGRDLASPEGLVPVKPGGCGCVVGAARSPNGSPLGVVVGLALLALRRRRDG